MGWGLFEKRQALETASPIPSCGVWCHSSVAVPSLSSLWSLHSHYRSGQGWKWRGHHLQRWWGQGWGEEGPECGLLRGKASRPVLVRLKRGTAGRQKEVPCMVLNISLPWLFVMEWSQQVTIMLPLSHQLTDVYPFGSFLVNQLPHSPHYLVIFF